MNKKFVFVGISIVLLVPMLLLPFFAVPAINDMRAKKLMHTLFVGSIPGTNTHIAEMCHYAGKLVGNGDGMDYFGAILIQSDATLDELKQHYASLGISVEAQDGQLIKQLDKKYYFKTNITGNNYYIIYKLDYTDNPVFWIIDIRGA